jgi:hypothetical protein
LQQINSKRDKMQRGATDLKTFMAGMRPAAAPPAGREIEPRMPPMTLIGKKYSCRLGIYPRRNPFNSLQPEKIF